ncbi:MAG: chalcone isomerase family protein [Rhodocyclaceae bacterium]
MKRLATVALGLMLGLVALGARAQVPLPPAVAGTAEWQLVGTGQMRWFAFRVYDASLWQAAGSQALAIRYARAIDSATLTEASIDEMARLGDPDAERWRAALTRHFPDVVADDVIVAVRSAAAGVRFYHQGRPTGVIDDPAFGERFFGIWLDARTREPDLRAALLGEASR